MSEYKEISYFENKERINQLSQFHKEMKKYVKNISYDGWVDGVIENDKAEDARSNINKKLHRYMEIIKDSGVSTVYIYTGAPLVGSPKHVVNILSNVFSLHQYEIPLRNVLDKIEQAIGIYESDIKSSIYRTINPLFWCKRLFVKIASIPFKIGIEIGIFKKDIQEGLFWKIWKSIFSFLGAIVGFIASLLTVLQITGKLDWFFSLLNK